jgi:hypothetical protein
MLRWLAPCILASASLACGQGRLLDGVTSSTTRLRLAPESFRGNVPCLKGAEGALQSYVVRFEQVSYVPNQPDAGLQRVTSGPVPCDQAAVLDAVAGYAYSADLYGFDTPQTDPAPPLSSARWTANCGRGGTTPDAGLAGLTYAVYGAIVQMGGCTTFSGEGGSDGTRLLVDQASALGELRCGSSQGQVSRLEGVLEGQRVSAACGQPLAFDVTGASRYLTIALTAFEASPGTTSAPSSPSGTADMLDASVADAAASDAAADAAAARGTPLDAGGPAGTPLADAGATDAGVAAGVPRWTTECLGKPQPGVTATATCEPLVALP